jgi:hypothetical protein
MTNHIGNIRYYLHAALTNEDWVFDYLTPAYNNIAHGNVVLSIELHDDKAEGFLLSAVDEVIEDRQLPTLDSLVDFVRYYIDKDYETEKQAEIPSALTEAIDKLTTDVTQAVKTRDLLLLSQVKIKHKGVVDMLRDCECDSLSMEAAVQQLGDSLEDAIKTALEDVKKTQPVSTKVEDKPIKVSKKEVEVSTNAQRNDEPIAQRKHVKVYAVDDGFEVDVAGRIFDAYDLDALKTLFTRKLGKQDATELYAEVEALYTGADDDNQDYEPTLLDCTLPIEERVTLLRRHYDLVTLGICEPEDEYDTMVMVAEALCDLDEAIDMTQPLETYIDFDGDDQD